MQVVSKQAEQETPSPIAEFCLNPTDSYGKDLWSHMEGKTFSLSPNSGSFKARSFVVKNKVPLQKRVYELSL